MSGAIRPPAAHPWGRAAGPCCPCFPGAGCVGVGTQHRPHSMRSCEPPSARCGGGGRVSPGGDASCRCEGPLRSGARPPRAACPPGGQSGSAAYVLWVPAWGRGGPALCLWRACPARGRAPRGWREVVLGRGALSPLRGASGFRRFPSHGRLSFGAGGQAPLPVFPGCGWCGRRDPAPAPQRALLRAGVARCGGGGRAFPGGVVAPRCCEGRLRSGACSPRAACPPERAVVVRCPGAVGVGVRAWGPGTVPLARVPCKGLRAAGVAERRPGGGDLSLLRGASGVRCFPSPGRPSLGAGSQAPLPVFPGRGWCRCGDPAPAPQRALSRGGVARCGGRGRASPGGCLLLL